MVNNRKSVSIVFAALADETRRRMLEHLARSGECRVGELAEPFSITAPAVTKHLRVLERARLVRRRKQGREHYIRPDAEGMLKANEWMTCCALGWQFSLKKLDERLAASRLGETKHV